jgi:hypothetical protein
MWLRKSGINLLQHYIKNMRFFLTILIFVGSNFVFADNTFTEFAKLEIADLKNKGLNDKHPFILSLQSIVIEQDEAAARLKVEHYFKNSRDEVIDNNSDNTADDADFKWIKMRCIETSDINKLSEAKKSLLTALSPIILSDNITELKPLPNGMLFRIRAKNIRDLAGFEFKLGHQFTMELVK